MKCLSQEQQKKELHLVSKRPLYVMPTGRKRGVPSFAVEGGMVRVLCVLTGFAGRG